MNDEKDETPTILTKKDIDDCVQMLLNSKSPYFDDHEPWHMGKYHWCCYEHHYRDLHKVKNDKPS